MNTLNASHECSFSLKILWRVSQFQFCKSSAKECNCRMKGYHPCMYLEESPQIFHVSSKSLENETVYSMNQEGRNHWEKLIVGSGRIVGQEDASLHY